MDLGESSQPSLESLPDDMLRLIVAKISSSSSTDFCNARLSCKSLKFNLNDAVISTHLKLTPLVKKPLKARLYNSLLDSCLKAGNLDAHFINGVVELYGKGNKYLGLHHLEMSSRGGHPEGSYLFGVISMCLGRIEKGKKIINKLTDSLGITAVERCWENVQVSLTGFTISVKKVYLKSYETMQPELNCHPGELNTVCGKCFHFFLVSEFVEMLLGLNTPVRP